MMTRENDEIKPDFVEQSVSLRDYFAARIIPSMISGVFNTAIYDRMAEAAYKIADSMIKARGTGDQNV